MPVHGLLCALLLLGACGDDSGPEKFSLSGDGGLDGGPDSGRGPNLRFDTTQKPSDASTDDEEPTADGSKPDPVIKPQCGDCDELAGPCREGVCDEASGSCVFTNLEDGLACGDPSLTACSWPDQCKAGSCEPRHTAAGTLCGDQRRDCHFDDTCDGNGNCVDKGLWTTGTACGDSTNGGICNAPDSCDAAGVCQPNVAPLDTICGDDGEPCKFPDRCDGKGLCIDSGVKTEGSSCGPADEPPVHAICHPVAYTCDAAGSCLGTTAADGTPCGDTTTNTECNRPDRCIAGTCSRQLAAVGTACGDSSDSVCDSADSCDATGKCAPNHADTLTQCASAGECAYAPLCDGFGSCAAAAPVVAGTACGNSSDTECTEPDTCDGAGSCQENHVTAGIACGDGSDTECSDPDSCDGAGSCAPNHAPEGSACGDTGITCTIDDSCDGSGQCQDNGFTATCAISGVVYLDAVPTSGVNISLYGTGFSTTSTSGGAYSLEVPLLEPVLLHVQAQSGYWGSVEARVFTAADAASSVPLNLEADATIQGAADLVGTSIDTALGATFLRFTGSGFEGDEGATLSASSATPIVERFEGGDIFLGTTLMSTEGGYMYIFDVSLGTTSVTPVAGANGSCSLAQPAIGGWPVLAHTITNVAIECQ
ncbi:MAG: hypothetical protein OEZ06_06360 [Myxococcales bacterium]|nr:hypothetical protein [Myxococcales bacterium]